MRKNKIILCVIIFALCIFIEDINACVRVDSGFSKNNFLVQDDVKKNTDGIPRYKRQCDGTFAFCLKHGAKAPVVDEDAGAFANVNACTDNRNLFTENVRAAIGYVMTYEATSNSNYAKKQRVIHKLTSDAGSGNQPDSYDSGLYNSAKEIRDYYSSNPTITLGSFSFNGTNYVASYTLSGIHSGVSATVTSNVGIVDQNSKTITISPSSHTNGVINVTLTVSYSKTYNLAISRSCSGGSYESIQSMAEKTEPITKNYSDTDEATINVSGQVDIIKLVEGTNTRVTSSHATFELYSGHNCSESNKVSTGTYQILGSTSSPIVLTPGNYSVKETVVPTGYEIVGNDCTNFTVTAGDQINLEIENRSECIADVLEKIGNNTIDNISVRLELYEKYNSENKEYKNLLDFNRKYQVSIGETIEQTAAIACSSPTINYQKTESCLATNQVIDSLKFDDKYLSSYNERIGGNGLPFGYCLTNFEIIKKQDIKTGISAGQLVINAPENAPIVTGKITKTCYIHKDDIKSYGKYIVVGESLPNKSVYEISPANNNDYIKNIPKLKLKPNNFTNKITASHMLLQVCESPDECEEDSIDWSDFWEEEYDYNKAIITSSGDYINYNDYVTSIEIDDITYVASNKIMKLKNLVATRNSESDEFFKLKESIEVDYIAKPIYTYKISGRPIDVATCIVDEENEILRNDCTIIGYGVASSFNDASINEPYFDFIINASENSIFSFNSENKCLYNVNEEIIEYEDVEDNGKLELEFRSIDKDSPFDRKTNSNWCDGENCDSNNNTVNSIIKGRNDSYNSTGAGGLYTNENSKRIVLTPDIIQKIRDYNNGKGEYEGNPHSYNDYTIREDSLGNKTSDFFEYIGLKKVIN